VTAQQQPQQATEFDLNYPQADFVELPHKFAAFVAGFGSGKTFVGCAKQLKHFAEFPKVNQGYFAPTYPLIRDIFYPTIEEVAFAMGFKVKIRTGDKEVDVYRNGAYYGTTICRTMDNPANIIGFKIGRALVDELDVLRADKARDAWRKIIARLRWPGDANISNGADVTTTPEGYKLTYELFKDDPKPSYGLIQASTYDNRANLPAGYIESLVETYPDQLISAYLRGQFVNLTSGRVYPNYERIKNVSFETVDGFEPVHIGMDFNVGKMAAVVHVTRGENIHAVDELFKLADTPAMIEAIKQRYPDNPVNVYPDSSGKNTSSKNASESDIGLLEQAGFSVHYESQNPRIKDRVLAMNRQFGDENHVGRYHVNVAWCPSYVKCLEQQAYNPTTSEPDKANDLDHLPDAGGYYIANVRPIIKPVLTHDIRMRR